MSTLIEKIAKRAKSIRAKSPNMSWQSALKKAGAELKGSQSTTSKRRTTTKKVAKKRSAKVGDPFYNAYKRAPLAVKKIIDQLGDEPDYQDLHTAAAKLQKMGWKMEYGLDAIPYQLTKIKTKSKKVGSVNLLPEHKPYFKKLTKLQAKNRKMNENKEVYGLRLDGSEKLIVFNKDFENPEFYAFGYEIGSVGKAKPKRTGSTHKDTKSHNVNIRVMSGTKAPKLQKAAVDMDALNGVIKFQSGKFYEVVKGANKGSVLKITSIRKPTNKKEGGSVKTYNVDFYEYRGGQLHKPFLGVVTDRWLNKRSVRPRLSVKSHEMKRFI